jgi:hypothetical protein
MTGRAPIPWIFANESKKKRRMEWMPERSEKKVAAGKWTGEMVGPP